LATSFEGDGAVEDAAGVDVAVQDVRHELLHVGAGGGDAAGEGDVAQELAEAERDLGVLRGAGAADDAAVADRAGSLDEGVLEADAFQHPVSAGTAGQVPHGGYAVLAALGDHVGGAELTAQGCLPRVAADHDDPAGAEESGCDDCGQADRAVADHGHGLARLDARGAAAW
jgi:hypothetical protein